MFYLLTYMIDLVYYCLCVYRVLLPLGPVKGWESSVVYTQGLIGSKQGPKCSNATVKKDIRGDNFKYGSRKRRKDQEGEASEEEEEKKIETRRIRRDIPMVQIAYVTAEPMVEIKPHPKKMVKCSVVQCSVLYCIVM